MSLSDLSVTSQVIAKVAMILSFVAGWLAVKYFWRSWYLLVVLEESETYKPSIGISYEAFAPYEGMPRTCVFEGPMSKTEAEVRKACYESKILQETNLFPPTAMTALCSREMKTYFRPKKKESQ